MIQLCRSDAIVKLFRDAEGCTLVLGRLREKPTVIEGLDGDGALEVLAFALSKGMAPDEPPELDGSAQ